jgi:hypothetical protein
MTSSDPDDLGAYGQRLDVPFLKALQSLQDELFHFLPKHDMREETDAVSDPQARPD